MMWYITLIIVGVPLLTQCQITNNADEMLNSCLDAKNHKSKPGPESSLYSQCSPWKERSCCTYNTTKESHHTNMYNFNFNHCEHIKNISEDCKRHFQQDLCFFECSPNIGPWVVKVNMKTRKERFYKVPLCQSDCSSWFDACIDDYTCTNNWMRNFDWVQGVNKCPQNAQCKTFKEIFGTAENFCQKVWDDSWEYTSDDQPCMRLWFDGTRGNPNEKVAQLKAAVLSQVNTASKSIVVNTIPVVILPLVLIFKQAL